MGRVGRPKGRPLNRNLFLENGVWIVRSVRGGRDWRRSTGLPKSEIARARVLRDTWLAERGLRRSGIEETPEPKTIDAVVEMYLAAESQPYDWSKGGEQPGTKRDSDGDRVIVKRLKTVLDFGIATSLLDQEMLLDAATKFAKAGFAPLTIRNSFRLLRRVLAWARSNKRKTGVTSNPFDELQRAETAKTSPKARKAEVGPFKREELRALYPILPIHVRRPIRFDAHTGMRWNSEVLRLTWSRIDLARRSARVDFHAKRGKLREVPLNDVAISILREILRENPNPKPGDPVFLNSEGGRLRDCRDIFNDAVRKVCPKPEAGWRYPDFHSLRRTTATALARVVLKPLISKVLGHAKEDVTDRYIEVEFEETLLAVNKAAALIDGVPVAENENTPQNVVDFATPAEKVVASSVASA